MSWYPKTHKDGAPGTYIVVCGDEGVRVYRSSHRTRVWFAKPRRTCIRHAFKTKKAAVEWAHDWLAEYA